MNHSDALSDGELRILRETELPYRNPHQVMIAKQYGLRAFEATGKCRNSDCPEPIHPILFCRDCAVETGLCEDHSKRRYACIKCHEGDSYQAPK